MKTTGQRIVSYSYFILVFRKINGIVILFERRNFQNVFLTSPIMNLICICHSSSQIWQLKILYVYIFRRLTYYWQRVKFDRIAFWLGKFAIIWEPWKKGELCLITFGQYHRKNKTPYKRLSFGNSDPKSSERQRAVLYTNTLLA